MGNVLEALSKWQRIKIIPDRKHDGEIKLFLDDLFQLSTYSEFKYHESLITLPMCATPSIDRVLICGAGDGMSLREALKFQYCKPTMIELDKGMIEIWRDMPEYAKYNNNSMKNLRSEVIIGDAINYMQNCQKTYNMIVWDFPGGDDVNNLYSPHNLNLMLNCLEQGGTFSTHVSIPLAKVVKIVQILKKQNYNCWIFDAYYDIQGNHDTFLVASQKQLRQERPVPESCQWANSDRVRTGFSQATEVTDIKAEYMLNFLDPESIESDE